MPTTFGGEPIKKRLEHMSQPNQMLKLLLS
ncbi:hypothetical protein [Staphylococcus aureus]